MSTQQGVKDNQGLKKRSTIKQRVRNNLEEIKKRLLKKIKTSKY
jgi:hypothetical protein